MTSLRVASHGGISRVRLWMVASAFLLWGGVVLWTLHGLQIRRVEELRAQARRQQERVVTAEATRGKILDRMGRPLAVSAEAYTVYASSEIARAQEGGIATLSRLLGVPRAKLSKKLSKNGFILLARRLAPDVADELRRAAIPGVELITESKRYYPQGQLAAHVLGFVVPDNPEFREGLESRYDEVIKGTPGTFLTLHDATGTHILLEEREHAKPGHDIVTSLDQVIQHIAERELARAMRESGASAGTVVVLHTPTGEVLAMANQPTFNPNSYGKSSAESRRNRAVTDYYEPGSTFKMVTAAAAIEEGLVRPSEVIDCGNGHVQVAGKIIRDHKPFGLLSFREVIEESSNGCAVKVGLRLGAGTFHDYIARFGFGARSGIDLPGETKGRLRPTREWSKTSQAYVSFGQEVAVSAVQIAAAFSAIANGGVYVAPRVVRRVLDPSGADAASPAPAPPRRIISEETAGILVDLMESAVFEGTGKAALVPGYRVAGKTGTAQKYVGGPTYSATHHVASFCGFVPARRPVLTIHVIVDEPRGALFHGGDVAAPVFSRIAAPALDYLDVPREPEFSPFEEPEVAGKGPGGRAVVPASKESKGGGSGRAPRPLLLPVPPRPFEPGDPAGGMAESPVRDATLSAPERGMPRPEPGGGVAVPDLTGASLRDAAVGLARMGLRAKVEGEGFVVGQQPPPGEIVAPGATVGVQLARWVWTEPEPPEAEAPAGKPVAGRPGRPR